MTWLINTTATPRLIIGSAENAQDFSNELESMTINDQSIANTGVMLTGGSITLVENPGGHRLEDYGKEKFGRNTVITLDLKQNDQWSRHPRGWLYILDSTYDPEQRAQELQVGCILTLYNLTDNIDNLKGFTPFKLPDEATFNDLQAAIETEGYFLWQDNKGVITKSKFFGTDGGGSNKQAAKWVSVRDQTCLSSSPLGAGSVVPDTIQIGYSWIEDAEDEPGNIGEDGKPFDEDLTESTYWLEHPAQIKKRQIVCQKLRDGTKDCREVIVNDAKQTFSVKKNTTNRRNYGGPGGSTSTELSVTRGPAVEIQGAYYAEYYAWEVARNGGKFSGIKLKGLDTVVQQRSEKTYTYGEGGEVIKTVEYRYQNMLSAMTQNDWRPGGAEPTSGYDPFDPPPATGRGFLTTPPKTKLFMQSQVTTEWDYQDDKTVETQKTLTSSAQCNGVGIFPSNGARVMQNIDADTNGTLTTVKRTSRGGQLNPDQPPRNPGEKSTVTRNGIYEEESAKYKPTDAGSVVYNTQMPFNVPSDDEAGARSRASTYAKTQRALIEGDAAGIRVAEAMRPELYQYYPGMPFSYVDEQEGKIIKLRMNASGWAINGSEAVFTTDGIFIGLSNGTLDPGGNVVNPNNTRKTRDGEDEPAYVPPSIKNETAINLMRGDQPDVMEVIGIDVPVTLGSYTGMGDDGKGVVPNWTVPIDTQPFWNLQNYVSGEKVSAEAGLLEVDGIGSIPDSNDSLLEGPSGILIPDLFDPNLEGLPEKTFFCTVGAPVVDQPFVVMVGPQPPDLVHYVSVNAPPPDKIFGVDVRSTYQIDVAEIPFIVSVFAEPVPEDNIFMVRTSADPADTIFDVSVMATPPSNTPDGQIFDIYVAREYEVRTGYAMPNKIYAISLGPRPAPEPLQIFGVSVGGPDAPPTPIPNEIYEIKVSFEAPDRIFKFRVQTPFEVVTAEPPFIVITSATPAARTFEITTNAPPVAPENIFTVTAEAEGADRILDVKVMTNKMVRVNYPPNFYTVSGNEEGIYRVTGMGYVYAVTPELRGFTGQGFSFSVDALANPFWITDTPDNSGTAIDPAKATVIGNGKPQGLVAATFLEPGTYYYASSSPGGPVGTIVIESAFATDPDQTYKITTGAKAVDPDNLFAITTSAVPADTTFPVTVFATPADGIFSTTVVETWVINAVDQLFDITVSEP